MIKRTNDSDWSLQQQGYVYLGEHPIEEVKPKDYINRKYQTDNCNFVYKIRINHHSIKLIKVWKLVI